MRTLIRHLFLLSTFVAISVGGGACSCSGSSGQKSDAGSDAGGPDAGVKGVPVVSISAPADMSAFASGAAISFEGSATDQEDGVLSGNGLIWSSNIEGQLGIGASVQSALATPGAHTITLSATDLDGNTTTASIMISITASELPVVVITSPADGQEAAVGEPIDFAATVTAAPGATIPGSQVVWSSDLDGQIGIGNSIRTGLASTGLHTITCTATDDQGKSGSASISVNVVTNRAPVVTIESPLDGAFVLDGATVSFRGTAVDPEDGPIAGAGLRWTSSMSGQIGIGNPVSTALPLGDHLISLNATDSQGANGEATVTVHVVSNLPPVCTISTPRSAATFVKGQTVDFVGNCVDPESGAPVANGLVWKSDLDGQLGLGGTVRTALPSAGDHQITLCAQDPLDAALFGCATVTISVVANTPPSCAISAPADGAVITVGAQVDFVGVLSDAEDPAITGARISAAWTDETGLSLSQQATARLNFGAAMSGAHTITFTGTDSGGLTCSASIGIVVNRNPTVSIDTVVQSASPTTPFQTGAPIDLAGSGSDPDGDPVVFDWSDNLVGAFGTGGTSSIVAPLPGNHHVVLTGTDPFGGQGTASRNFQVLPAGQASLVEAFPTVNNLAGQGQLGRVISLGVDPNDLVYAGNNNAEIWSFDGTTLNATPTGFAIPADVQSIVYDAASGYVYLGTTQGYLSCVYSPVTGLDPATCNFFIGNDLPSDNVTAILRVTIPGGQDQLVVATRNGILIANNANGSSRGTVMLAGKEILSLASEGTLVWVGSRDDGLYLIDPANGSVVGQWQSRDGAPSNRINGVAVGLDAVWVATDKGLGRFEQAASLWTVWKQGQAPAPGLVNDNCQAIAIAQTPINGSSREIVWVGTRGGVSRFDLSIPAFMSLTTNEGLPSNDVRSMAILSDGTKIFGTNNGVARYTGP